MTKFKSILKLFLTTNLLLILISCHNNSLDIDISDINTKPTIIRFDQILQNINTDSISEEVEILREKYNPFFDLYNIKIIEIGSSNQNQYPDYLLSFLTDFTITEINKRVKNKFSDFDDTEYEIVNAFKHYAYYYPEKETPTIYTYLSGFNQSIVIAENIIGISLDKYLGEDADLYEAINTARYLRKKMNSELIPVDCIKAWGSSEFPFNDSIDNLISHIIYNGKIMYFTDAMLPKMHDSLKIAYSNKQLEWCYDNEQNMWTYLIENKALFSTDFIEIKKYTENAPFTASFTKDSPGETGVWIGWQIVRSYMKNNTSISLQELMKSDNYIQILNNSKYNP